VICPYRIEAPLRSLESFSISALAIYADLRTEKLGPSPLCYIAISLVQKDLAVRIVLLKVSLHPTR
jgi:hypothetical protein